MSFLDKFLALLEKHLPTFLLAFGLGRSMSKKKNRDLEIEKQRLEIDNALFKNKETINNRFDGMSNSDVIDAVSGADKDPDRKTD